jgi:1-acyl-sn-glycerol-3-phosphate acyltransferase
MDAAEALKGIFYRYGSAILYLFLKLLFRLRVQGREKIPPQGGVILVSRHRSYWDVPVLIAALGGRHRIYFVARKTLLDEHLLLRPFIAAYAICIDRENFRREDYRNVMAAVESGKIVGIFPEGTTRTPQRIHPGVVRFAERGARDFLPILIEARGPYPPKYPFRFGQLTVRIGRPFSLRDLEFDRNRSEDRFTRYERLSQLVMQRVDQLAQFPESEKAKKDEKTEEEEEEEARA